MVQRSPWGEADQIDFGCGRIVSPTVSGKKREMWNRSSIPPQCKARWEPIISVRSIRQVFRMPPEISGSESIAVHPYICQQKSCLEIASERCAGSAEPLRILGKTVPSGTFTIQYNINFAKSIPFIFHGPSPQSDRLAVGAQFHATIFVLMLSLGCFFGIMFYYQGV